MTLPPRRERPKSGIERAPRREWPRHRAFVRAHACSVPHCIAGPIEVAHVRSAANSGTGLKPHDRFTVSLCRGHHIEQHEIGQPAFEKLYRIDLLSLADEFVARSPDVEMRKSMLVSDE